ncbi:MAG: ethanolamine utilization protein EutH [Clostridia bacterium]|nr:ethanolamine utilization protein EutH [Clostridia bacterium]
MNILLIVMTAFAVLGAVDLIIGNRIGIGEEFERGMKMFGPLALSMLGMIVLSPLIAHFLLPVFNAIAKVLPFEPSVGIASLLANDMGGATLALQFATTPELGYFNGLVVGSMMGATISFTLPFALCSTEQSQRKSLSLGLMCGICAIPVGCFVAGLVAKLPILTLLMDLIPLLLFSALLSFGLLKFPDQSVEIFNVVGLIIKALVTVGLAAGLVQYLLGVDVPYVAPIEEGVAIVFNVCAVLAGAFPLVCLFSKALKKPLKALGDKWRINETSALGLLSTLATSVTAFGMMKDMDEKGVVFNSAFAVSAAFTFADHMAFTMSFQPNYLPCVIVGKLAAGVAALVVAQFVYGKRKIEKEKQE